MKVKHPIKLEFEAFEQEDGGWKLSYREYFKAEDLEAYRTTVLEGISQGLMKGLPSLNMILDEYNCVVIVKYSGSRTAIFDYLCGEFFVLSGIAQRNLQEIFILAGLGAKSLMMEEIKSAE